jgi:hypothetical protein
MIVKEPWYSRFKWLLWIVVPAFNSAYFALSDLLDLDNALQVVGVLSIVSTFLGVILGISNNAYQNSDARFDGDAVVIPREDDVPLVSLDLNADIPLVSLAERSSLTFKVVEAPPAPEDV